MKRNFPLPHNLEGDNTLAHVPSLLAETVVLSRQNILSLSQGHCSNSSLINIVGSHLRALILTHELPDECVNMQIYRRGSREETPWRSLLKSMCVLLKFIKRSLKVMCAGSTLGYTNLSHIELQGKKAHITERDIPRGVKVQRWQWKEWEESDE